MVDSGPKIPIALLAAAGILVVLMLATGLWVVLGSGGDEPQSTAELPQLPTPSEPAEAAPEELLQPAVELPQQMLDALELFVGDDLLGARTALQEIAELVEEGELPAEVCSAYHALDEAVLRARVASVGSELGQRLQRGDVAPLRRLLDSLDARERSVLDGSDATQSSLADAEGAVTAVADFERAERTAEPIPLTTPG